MRADNSERVLALVGNPNVGKSVIFNLLTGRYATVSNYPGTTVEVSRGPAKFGGINWQVADTPGMGSMIARSDDERVAREMLIRENPDVIVQVIDEKNLSRSLVLTVELLELGRPMVLAMNMSDEALDRGIRTDIIRLSELLDASCVVTIAVAGQGIGALQKAVVKALDSPPKSEFSVTYPSDIESALDRVEAEFHPGSRAAAVLALCGHPLEGLSAAQMSRLRELTAAAQEQFPMPLESVALASRQNVAAGIARQVQRRVSDIGWERTRRFDRFLMHPVFGYAAALAALFIMYEFVGKFGAGVIVDFTENTIFGKFINPVAVRFFDAFVPWAFARDLFVGQYGIITMAITYSAAIILPVVACFFLFFGILEDSGYLPRLSVMMDRAFRLIGLNGKAVLPVILGLGCDTMATVTTRILETRRERVLVSLLLTLSIPCSAQMGVTMALLAGLSWKVTAAWVFVVAASTVAVGWAASRIIGGRRGAFLTELPPLRVPDWRNLLNKVRIRVLWYIKEAVPLFIAATAGLFVLDRAGLLPLIERAASPVVRGLLGLPTEAARAFIMGFFRRDYGVAGFYLMSHERMLSQSQVLISIVTITLFVPCLAHFLMTVRERGLKTALVVSAFVTCYALAIGSLLNALLSRVPLLG